MTSHQSPISSVASFDNYIATAGYDNQVILWHKASRQFLNRGCHDHLANYITFSPCGQFLLSTSSDYSARIWTVPDMRLTAVLSAHNDDVENASFSSNGDHIATASRDHKVRVFTKGGELVRSFEGHTADVLSVAWLNDDTELVSSSDDGTIRIWNVASGNAKLTISFDDVETDTCDVFGQYVFAGNDKGEINIIDTVLGELAATIPGHQAGIKAIRLSQAHKLLVSSSYDRTAKVWRINDAAASVSEMLTLAKTIECPSSLWLRAVNIVDAHTLAFGTFGSSFALYNLEDDTWDFANVADTHGRNAVLKTNAGVYSVGDAGIVYLNEQEISRVGSLCNFLLQVGDMIVTGGQTGELFNARTGDVIHVHHSPINCGTTWRDGDDVFAVIGCYTGEGEVFRYQEGKLLHQQSLSLHANAIKGLACNGKTIFSVSANTDAAFHDAKSFSLLRHIHKAHRLIANGADVLPDGRYVSVSRDRKLRFWDDSFNYQEIETPHTHSVKCVKVGAGSRSLVACAAYNGLCCVYDVEQEAWVYNKRLSSSGISSLSAIENDNAFLASCYDGMIYSILL